jgi:ribose 5-phosphate isomerase B
MHLKSRLIDQAHQVVDVGTDGPESCDYSRYALVVARSVAKGEYDRGLLICGTGVGMSMAANRIGGARAAHVTNEYLARMSRAHNDSNILCLGQRVTGFGLAESILDEWLAVEFEGGRHQRRIDIFNQIY